MLRTRRRCRHSCRLGICCLSTPLPILCSFSIPGPPPKLSLSLPHPSHEGGKPARHPTNVRPAEHLADEPWPIPCTHQRPSPPPAQSPPRGCSAAGAPPASPAPCAHSHPHHPSCCLQRSCTVPPSLDPPTHPRGAQVQPWVGVCSAGGLAAAWLLLQGRTGRGQGRPLARWDCSGSRE